MMGIVGLVLAVVGVLFAFERPRKVFLRLLGVKAQSSPPSSLAQVVPPALAEPVFSIKQRGFRGVAEQEPTYSFEITNNGGDCFNFTISTTQLKLALPFSKIARDQSKTVEVSLPRGTQSLDIVLSGLDANGNTYKKVFFGTRYTSGFEFT